MKGPAVFIFLGLLTLRSAAKCPGEQIHPQREILCYTSFNDPKQLEDKICRCTTLVHKGHDLQDLDTSGIRGLREILKEINPNIDFVLSIDDHKKSLKTSAGAVQEAIAKISSILNEVDGVELNLSAGAKERLVHFVQGLKGEMIRRSEERRILLALPTKNELLAKEFDLKSLAKYVDLFTTPTHYLTSDEDLFRTFHPSRLMGLSDLLNSDSVVDLIHGLGVDKGKILISLPASGYKFTLKDKNDNAPNAPALDEKPLTVNRKEFCEMIEEGEWIIERDSDLTAPYIFNDSSWIAFEDEISTRIKGKYVLLRDLAGLAIDEVGNDFESSCGRSITEEVYHSFTDNERKTREAVLNSLEEDIQTTENPYPTSVKQSDFRIVQVVDSAGKVRAIRENTQTEFTCLKQGHFVHPKSCNRFYRCVKFNQQVEDYSVFEFDCPEGLSFDERTEVCVWPGSMPQGSPCPGSSEIAPTAPRKFRCPGEGYYADPNNCRWFYACMNLGEEDMIPYEFRCPFGLVFDERKLVCEWPWLVPACAGKNYAYNGGYDLGYESVYSGRSTDLAHGQNGDVAKWGESSDKSFRQNSDRNSSQDGYGSSSKDYTSTIHSIRNSYGTTSSARGSSSSTNLGYGGKNEPTKWRDGFNKSSRGNIEIYGHSSHTSPAGSPSVAINFGYGGKEGPTKWRGGANTPAYGNGGKYDSSQDSQVGSGAPHSVRNSYDTTPPAGSPSFSTNLGYGGKEGPTKWRGGANTPAYGNGGKYDSSQYSHGGSGATDSIRNSYDATPSVKGPSFSTNFGHGGQDGPTKWRDGLNKSAQGNLEIYGHSSQHNYGESSTAHSIRNSYTTTSPAGGSSASINFGYGGQDGPTKWRDDANRPPYGNAEGYDSSQHSHGASATSPSIPNSYVTTASKGLSISTLSPQDNNYVTATPNSGNLPRVDGGVYPNTPLNIKNQSIYKDIPKFSVGSEGKLDKLTPGASSIQTSNSGGIITGITRPGYFTTKNEKPGFAVPTNQNGFYGVSLGDSQNPDTSSGDNNGNVATASGTSSFTIPNRIFPGSVGSNTAGVTSSSSIPIGNEYYTNQAGTGIKSQSKYYPSGSNIFGSTQPTQQYHTGKPGGQPGIGTQFEYTPGVNVGVTNHQFTQSNKPGLFGSTGIIPNEIPPGVTPALSSQPSGFGYTKSPYVTPSYPAGLSVDSTRNQYPQSKNGLSPTVTRGQLPDYSVPVPEGSNGNKLFTNHASSNSVYKGNPFLPSTPPASSGGLNGNEIYSNGAGKNSVYRGNPFLPSTPAASFEKSTGNEFFHPSVSTTSIGGAQGGQTLVNHASRPPIYKGNPFLPSTPATSFEETTGNQFFPNYPSRNPLYKGNPFLPPTSATASGNAYYSNQAGNPKEVPLSQSDDGGYKTNEYFDNGGRGTIRYNNGSITHKYTEGDVKNGNIPFQSPPPTLIDESFRPIGGIYTTGGFTKTGPTKTGITTAQLGGSGTYIPGITKPIPVFNPLDNGEDSFGDKNHLGGSINSQQGWSPVNIGTGKIPQTSGYPSSVESSVQSTASVYNEMKGITTQTPFFNIQVDNRPTVTARPAIVVDTSSPGLLPGQDSILKSTSEPPFFSIQVESKPTRTSGPIAANTLPSELFPGQSSTPFSVSSTAEPIDYTTREISNDGYRNKVSSTSSPASITTDDDQGDFLNIGVLSQGPNRQFPSSSTEYPLKNNKIDDLGNRNKQFPHIPGSTFEQTNYGPTESPDDGHGYADKDQGSTGFGQRIFKDRDGSTRPQIYNPPSSTSTVPIELHGDHGQFTKNTQDYGYSKVTTKLIDNSGSTVMPEPSKEVSKWGSSENKVGSTGLNEKFDKPSRPGIYTPPSSAFTPTIGRPSVNPATASEDDDSYSQSTLKPVDGSLDINRGAGQPTPSSPGGLKERNNYNRGSSKYKPPYADESDENNDSKITTEAPPVTTYNGGYRDSSLALSSGIDKSVGVEKRGKVVVKYSDLHPVLLEKLEAECTCRSDPFTIFKSNKPLLIDSSKGVVDLRNYDETDVYVELESDKNYDENKNGLTAKYGTPVVTSNLPSSDNRMSASFNINKSKFRGGKSLSNFDSNQAPKAEGNIGFLDVNPEGKAECARPGLFRHPKFCNKFYVCSWDQWKKKFTLNVSDCPVHLTFDSNAGACNWPSKGPACQGGHLLV